MRSASPVVALVVLVGLALLSALSLALSMFQDRDPRPTVWGVRLGMTATDVRQRVEERGPGEWSTRLEGGDWVLERSTPHEHATFELHDGQLVAVRIEGPIAVDLPATPPYELTDGSVLVRTVRGDQVETTLLSRACPTHHEEAERLVRVYAGGTSADEMHGQ